MTQDDATRAASWIAAAMNLDREGTAAIGAALARSPARFVIYRLGEESLPSYFTPLVVGNGFAVLGKREGDPPGASRLGTLKSVAENLAVIAAADARDVVAQHEEGV